MTLDSVIKIFRAGSFLQALQAATCVTQLLQLIETRIGAIGLRQGLRLRHDIGHRTIHANSHGI